MTEATETTRSNGQPRQKAAISLACESCRKKKIKCSGKPAPCAHCKQANLECTFAAGPKPRRTPIRSSRRIDGLEKRLSQIEALLKEAVNPAKHKAEQPVPSPDKDTLPRPPDSDNTNGNVVVSTPATTSTSGPPPLTQSERLLLANHYFDTMNRFLPLFDEASLIQSIREDYTELKSRKPALWAAVNVVFALSHQLSAQQPMLNRADHQTQALHFVENAMSVVGQLSTREPTLLCLQVLLGIAKVWQATSTPQTATMYLAMAVRQVYHLNLHQSGEEDDAGEETSEWNKRLFWQTYALDKDFSLHLDQPHALNDEDLDVNLPSWNPRDGLGFLPTKKDTLRINYFRLQANLATIQGKIYTRLYSRQSLRQPQVDLAENAEPICDLVTMLLAWKSQIPVEFDSISLVDALPQYSITALVIMYVRYFNCLTMLHRLSFWKVGHLEAYQASFENITTNPCPSHGLCIEGARTALRLFCVLPQGNVPVMWLLSDYFVSAVVILLAGIIYDSFLSLGWQDLQLVEPVIVQLDLLARSGDTKRLENIRSNCTELMNAAKNWLKSCDNADPGIYPDSAFKIPLVLDEQAIAWLYNKS